MNKVELLAPAGDLERLKWALMYGADAVYIGGRNFSLRANAKNFSIEEIKEACDYAHKLNKKVFGKVYDNRRNTIKNIRVSKKIFSKLSSKKDK